MYDNRFRGNTRLFTFLWRLKGVATAGGYIMEFIQLITDIAVWAAFPAALLFVAKIAGKEGKNGNKRRH